MDTVSQIGITRFATDAEATHAVGVVTPEHTPDPTPEPDRPVINIAKDESVERTQHLQQIFEKAVRRELKLPDGYRNVAVLMIRWADHLDPKLKCKDELEELKQLFNEDFGFHCADTVLLDTQKRPQNQLNSAVSRFVEEHDGSHRENLLIVYYTGHGHCRTNKTSESDDLYVAGTEDPEHESDDVLYRAEVHWQQCERDLENAEADVLEILDCCFAGSVVKESRKDLKAFQTLAAAGKDQTTSGPGPRSYTRALIGALKEQLGKSRGEAFNTLDLHQVIQRKKSKAQLLNRREGFRTIRLAPMKAPPPINKLNSTPPATGHLDIRLVFSSHPTTPTEAEERIGDLGMRMARAVNKVRLDVMDIEWLQYESKTNSPWLTVKALRQLKASAERKRINSGNSGDDVGAASPKRRKPESSPL